jgi:DNA polymerase III subunit delta
MVKGQMNAILSSYGTSLQEIGLVLGQRGLNFLSTFVHGYGRVARSEDMLKGDDAKTHRRAEPRVSGVRGGSGFATLSRFLHEIEAAAAGKGPLKPGYVLAGDELFLLDRCRAAILKAFVPPDLKEFCLSDLDLADTSIFDVLDRAQTPSLMSPFQVVFVRNVRLLYTRGAKRDEFAALDRYFRSPNPQALVIFIADFLRIPADARRMEMDDRNRFERIRETLGEHCGIIELARVNEEDAMRWAVAATQEAGARLDPDAARELVDALGGDMMLIASELEKLLLYTQGRTGVPTDTRGPQRALSARWGEDGSSSVGLGGRITLGDVETMVLAAKQRSLYELTDAISARDRVRALALLHGLLNSSNAGEDAAIGHLYMLSRTFRQMLVILEKNVRDSRAIWQALWQGFRMPPFAADDLIRQARRYKSRRDLARAIRLVARADRELRSQPPDKRLVLERLVYELASEPKHSTPILVSAQLSLL